MLPLTASSSTYDWLTLESNKQPQIAPFVFTDKQTHEQQKLGIKVGCQYFGCRTLFPNQLVHALFISGDNTVHPVLLV